MNQPEHVCRVSFIPKDNVGKDGTQVKSQNVISQFIFMGEFTIGSSKDANIVYKSRGVHALHCKIKVKGKQVFVTDLFSSQGITVNGKKITVGTPFPVRSNEHIQLGSAQDVITVELFRKPGDPKEETTQILHEAETTALKMMKEADQIFKEASSVEEKTASIIAEAEAKANEIVLEKKREMQEQFEAKIREAIEEGHKQANEIVAKAEREVESIRVEMENKSYEVGKKREEQSKGIVKEAERRAEEIINSAKNQVQAMLEEGEAKAQSVAATGETRKQEALKARAEVLAEIESLKNTIADLKTNIDEVTEENKQLMEKNAQILADTKNFSEEFEKADAEFKEYVGKLTDEKDQLSNDLNLLKVELNSTKEDLQHSLSKNDAVKKDTKATEIKKRDLVSQIQKHEQEIQDLKNDIQTSIRQKDLAIAEAEKARQKTTQDIAKLKKEFEGEYQRRKQAIEERFADIRERERLAAQERRDMLKKHEKERLPSQVKNIATAIWNELSVELQDQTVKAEFFSADTSIPKTIESIVERSIQEEYDLRTKIASQVPLYKDVDKKVTFIKKFGEGSLLTGAGALFMLFVIYFGAPANQVMVAKSTNGDRKVSSTTVAEKSSVPSETPIPAAKGWQTTYSNNLLYNENFEKFLKYQKTNKLHQNRLDMMLTGTLQLNKGKKGAFLLKEAGMIVELRKIMKDINDSNRAEKMKLMRATEDRYRQELQEILGDETKLNSFLNFQAQEFNSLVGP